MSTWLHRWLGIWSRADQRRCPHPEHRVRHIHGDERNFGYPAQCMECGHLFRHYPVGP